MEVNPTVAVAERVKDAAELREALWDDRYTPLPVASLARLLLEDWHDSHEDIVFELGLIGDPQAVGPILKAAAIPFTHLVQWNNLHEFQRKCAYALARIGTDESRAALQVLAQCEDPYLREYGEEGLRHWPMSYRSS